MQCDMLVFLVHYSSSLSYFRFSVWLDLFHLDKCICDIFISGILVVSIFYHGYIDGKALPMTKRGILGQSITWSNLPDEGQILMVGCHAWEEHKCIKGLIYGSKLRNQQRKRKNSGRLWGGCLNSNSGTAPPRLSPLPLCVVGSTPLTCLSFGRFWLFIGWFCSSWLVS